MYVLDIVIQLFFKLEIYIFDVIDALNFYLVQNSESGIVLKFELQCSYLNCSCKDLCVRSTGQANDNNHL